MSSNLNSLAGGMPVGAGRYVLLQMLGKGGMGVVWLALDERLDEQVALKFLPAEIQFDPSALDDMRRETARSRKLAHPNIIRIHDLHEFSDEAPFISMEFVDEQTLSHLKTGRPGRFFPWEELRPTVQQLCEALDYAHSERIIHRDLKPGNMMLDTTGRLKLADFGIAAVASDSMSRVSLQGNTSGTPAYMSPQQMDGRTPRVTDDLYALGALLYEMLFSKPPFFRGDVIHQVRTLSPDSLEERLQEFGIDNPVPKDVEAMIMACLSKDPDQRPQSARAVAEWIGLSSGDTTGPRTLSSQVFVTDTPEVFAATRTSTSIESIPTVRGDSPEEEISSEEADDTDISSDEPPTNRRAWLWRGTAAAIAIGGLTALNRRRRRGGNEPDDPDSAHPAITSPELTDVGAGVSRLFANGSLEGCSVLTTTIFENQRNRYQESKGRWTRKDSNWTIKDGIITGTVTAEPGSERRSYLIFDNLPVDDFELGFAWRDTTEGDVEGNFGLFYRARERTGEQQFGHPAIEGPAIVLGSGEGNLFGVPENRVTEPGRFARMGKRPMMIKPGMRPLFERLRDTSTFRDGGSFALVIASGDNIRHIITQFPGREFRVDPQELPSRGFIAIEIWVRNGTRSVDFEQFLLRQKAL